MDARASWRRTGAKVLLIGLLVMHAVLLVRGGDDPHKLFGFRPFNESDTWRAEIVRVTADGQRLPVNDGTWEYDWNELVGTNKLLWPARTRHAAAGASATLDFLDRALTWVALNTPRDHRTVRLEATVTVHRNTRGPEIHHLRSPDRPVAGVAAESPR